MKEFFSLLFHGKWKALFISPTENGIIQFFRFIFVGTTATFVDLLTTTVAYEYCGLNHSAFVVLGFDMGALLASAIGFIVGLLVNYVLSIIWIFRNENINRLKEFAEFTLIGIIGLFVKLAMVGLLERFVFDLNSKLWIIPMVTVVSFIATLIAFLWNFFARKYILYGKKNHERIAK